MLCEMLFWLQQNEGLGRLILVLSKCKPSNDM